jgi:hypothetical protein
MELLELPTECLISALKFLDATSLARFACCSRACRELSQEDILWEYHLRRFDRYPFHGPVFRQFARLTRCVRRLLSMSANGELCVMRDRKRNLLYGSLQNENSSTVFSVCPMSAGFVLAGGSIPDLVIFNRHTQTPSFYLTGSSGLCMSHDRPTGIVAAGSFQGGLSIWKHLDDDPVRYLSNQSVRYLKQLMATRKKSWAGLQEKSEMIDAILSTHKSDDILSFPALASVDVTLGHGLVHAEIVGDYLYAGGFENG